MTAIARRRTRSWSRPGTRGGGAPMESRVMGTAGHASSTIFKALVKTTLVLRCLATNDVRIAPVRDGVFPMLGRALQQVRPFRRLRGPGGSRESPDGQQRARAPLR